MEARIDRYIGSHLDLLEAYHRGNGPRLTALSDILSLDHPLRSELIERYRAIFRSVRDILGHGRIEGSKEAFTVRAHVLLEIVTWLPAWIGGYAATELPRIRKHLVELLVGGVSCRPCDILSSSAEGAASVASDPPETKHAFLRAATRIVNERGYQGASVERIAAELKVTKGSFYHHLDAKDELIMACFENSFSTIASALDRADRHGGAPSDRLAFAIGRLLTLQFSELAPLLRTTALQALPPDLHAKTLRESNRLAMRFAGLAFDGVIEGSIRPLDPFVMAQALMAALNGAYVLHRWASETPSESVSIYVGVLMGGLLGSSSADCS